MPAFRYASCGLLASTRRASPDKDRVDELEQQVLELRLKLDELRQKVEGLQEK